MSEIVAVVAVNVVAVAVANVVVPEKVLFPVTVSVPVICTAPASVASICPLFTASVETVPFATFLI